MTIVIIYASIIIIIMTIIPFSVFIHELGHGIPALIFTKGKITLYVGSNGDPNRSLQLRLGRLEIFFRYNPFVLSGGLCVPHSNPSRFIKQAIIIIMGPVASLFFGIIFCLSAFYLDAHGSIKIISVLFLSISILDFWGNLIPKDQPYLLYDGSIIYNDGQQLKQLFRYRTYPAQFAIAADYYNAKEFEKAAKAFQAIINNGIQDVPVYKNTMSAYYQIKDYKSALEIHDKLEKLGKLDAVDYFNSAFIKSKLGGLEEGLLDYFKSLELNPSNSLALCNRGYTYNLLERYEEAILDFDSAIAIEPDDAYAYNNRGLAKIKLGYELEGLSDIQISMNLDNKNAYAHRNLGIYHFDKGNFKKALDCFETAFEFDNETDLIEEYLTKTKTKLMI